MLDGLFGAANLAAITGWIALGVAAFLPAARPLLWRYAGTLLPVALGLAYLGLIAAFWFRSGGGFSSLADVRLLFDMPGLLLAGWIHYLAFDLLVGAWIARQAATAGVPAVLLLPCLGLTFLFGPAGYLLFLAIRAARAPQLAEA
ncbi:MAG: abscisic acid-deficient protein Aba4 family protein [Alphaproteobacteria bacterium]